MTRTALRELSAYPRVACDAQNVRPRATWKLNGSREQALQDGRVARTGGWWRRQFW
jgi:hypothetical protein